MKLRLRPFDSKETLKIDVPNPCSLSQLKQILVQSLPNSPSPDSIRLSLNRKDELQSDGGDFLHSIGIATGDLIYFSLDQPVAAVTRNPQNTLPQVTAFTSLSTQNTLPEARNFDVAISGVDSQRRESLDRVSQMEETVEEMEVDDEDSNENSYETDGVSADEVVDKSFSVPGFLRKVFMEELGDDTGKDHKLIVVAVHAVMLESGFLGFDKNTNIEVNGFHFRNEWPSGLFRLSLYYTLQESLGHVLSEAVKCIVLKFQSLGKFINVYGTLENGSGKRGVYRLQLDEDQLAPFLNVVWANCGLVDNINGENGSLLSTSPQKEVFKFWRNVKDNLASPLLIDLCEELGLELPPCFMRLPTDLKLKILETLSGVEIAKVSCVCSELRYLGSSDDLWKMKFADEFGGGRKEAQGSWKKAFADRRKSRKVNRARVAPFWPAPCWAQPRRRRYPNQFMVSRVPRIIGDDYDVPPRFDSIPRSVRSFSPQCDLGVRGGRLV